MNKTTEREREYQRRKYDSIKHTLKYKEARRKRRKKMRDELHNYYIKHQLKMRGFRREEITPELIAVKRAHLQLKRNIKAKREEERAQPAQSAMAQQYFTELEEFLQKF